MSKPQPGSSDQGNELRDVILQQTLGVVRRRRHWRYVRNATLLAGCYLAGVLTMAGIEARSQPHDSAVLTHVEVKSPPQKIATAKSAPPAKQTAYDRQRQQGDRALKQSGGVDSAVYRYARAVSLASPEQRAVNTQQDHWLLMALKLAENKEL